MSQPPAAAAPHAGPKKLIAGFRRSAYKPLKSDLPGALIGPFPSCRGLPFRRPRVGATMTALEPQSSPRLPVFSRLAGSVIVLIGTAAGASWSGLPEPPGAPEALVEIPATGLPAEPIVPAAATAADFDGD